MSTASAVQQAAKCHQPGPTDPEPSRYSPDRNRKVTNRNSDVVGDINTGVWLCGFVCVRVTQSGAAVRGSSAATGKCWCCPGASGALLVLAGSGRSHSPLGLPCTGHRQTLELAVPGLKEKKKEWMNLA